MKKKFSQKEFWKYLKNNNLMISTTGNLKPICKNLGR